VFVIFQLRICSPLPQSFKNEGVQIYTVKINFPLRINVKSGLILRENTDRGGYKIFGPKREKRNVLNNFLRDQSRFALFPKYYLCDKISCETVINFRLPQMLGHLQHPVTSSSFEPNILIYTLISNIFELYSL
jgi:hypothetical protein